MAAEPTLFLLGLIDHIMLEPSPGFLPPQPDLVQTGGAEERVFPDGSSDSLPPPDLWAGPSQILSWVVVIGCTGLLMLLVFAGKKAESEAGDSQVSLVQADLATQYAIGTEPWLGEGAKQTLDGIANGPIPQRLARIVVLAELWSQAGAKLSANPSEQVRTRRQQSQQTVLGEFNAINEQMAVSKYQPSEAEQKLIAAAQRVVEAKLAGEPVKHADADVQLLVDHLGFAGKLAAAWGRPDSTELERLRAGAGRKVLVIFGFMGSVLGAAFLGFGLAIVLVLLIAAGQIHSRMSPAAGYGYLHLEAFAVWFVSFLLAQIMMGLLMQVLGLAEEGGAGVWPSLVVFYLPVLVALGWLMVRHPHPRQALREVGFTTRGLPGDFGKAILTHLAFLPLVGLAILITIGLTMLLHAEAAEANPFAPPPGPSHPIQEQFDGRWSTALMLFFLAAVTAPIVEETVFRGLFYRYLRDWTGRSSLLFSIFVATTINAFIFASIHPQGLLGIPPLMALAAAMSVAREWSGGLLAPMTIHAINNGALVCFMSIMFS